MSVRTPNYRLIQDHTVSSGSGLMGADYKTLPAGSYVRPIELSYVPPHVKEDSRWKYFNKELEVFAYTKFGIIPIPKYILRDE